MTPPIRGIWIDKDTHTALVEYAWLYRTTMSDVIRLIIKDIGTKPIRGPVLDVTDRPGRKRLSVKTDPEEWDAAALAASKAGVGFHSLIRRHIIKALREEGLLE